MVNKQAAGLAKGKRLVRSALQGMLLAASAAALAQPAVATAQALDAEARRQRVLALQLVLGQQQRIERVGYPLLRVGSPDCVERRRHAVGLSPRSAQQVADDLRPAAAAAGLTDGLAFDQVLDGTPLQRAGVLPGDALLALNGEAPPADAATAGWFEQRVHALAHRREPLLLRWMHAAAVVETSVTPHQICDLGLYLAAAAGVDVAEAPAVWRRMAAHHPASIADSHSKTHPGTAERFLRLEDTLAELRSKQQQGQPLRPAVVGLPAFNTVPFVNEAGRPRHAHDLGLPQPKAFFIAGRDGWRFVTGQPDPVVAGFAHCSAKGLACALYAVNHTVVWQADAAQRTSRLNQLAAAPAPSP